jgi:xylose isomerase
MNWNFGARLNSFSALPYLFEDGVHGELTFRQQLRRASTVVGLNSVDLNYPDHFKNEEHSTLRDYLGELELECNGVATRFGDSFVRGDFANPSLEIRRDALQLADEAATACKAMGGEVLTLWFAHDGFDYPFEGEHLTRYQRAVNGVRELSHAHPDLKISIEYKPYQPRAFTSFADVGTVLLAIRDIGASNVGITLDYCHMLMKRENPSQSLALAMKDRRLFGVHLNDGYGDSDDGMMVGSVSLSGLLEFVFYLMRYEYSGLIYFDTFPDRIDPVAECQSNIDTIKAVHDWIHHYGMDTVANVVESADPIATQRMLIDLLRSAASS